MDGSKDQKNRFFREEKRRKSDTEKDSPPCHSRGTPEGAPKKESAMGGKGIGLLPENCRFRTKALTKGGGRGRRKERNSEGVSSLVGAEGVGSKRGRPAW